MIWVILILLIIVLIFFIIERINTKNLVKYFELGNVIVFGKKRKGKDLLFNKVINARKRIYYANMPYNRNGYNHLEMRELNINTSYTDFIEGDIKKCDSPLKYDNTDYYITDAGIYLPSQYDTILSKQYKTLPIIYALSSQVFKCNIHINTQALNRVWLKLREQADTYIKVKKTIKIFGFFITLYTIYDKYSSAEKELAPLKGRFLNSFSQAEKDKYECENGFIKNAFIIQRKKHIYYDTHYFRTYLLNEPPKLLPYKDKSYRVGSKKQKN